MNDFADCFDWAEKPGLFKMNRAFSWEVSKVKMRGTPKKVRKMSHLIMLVGLAGLIVTVCTDITVIGVLSISAVIAGLLVNCFFYRCPACGAHLGRVGVDYCGQCGKKVK